jgi:hypothetical protein
MTVARNVACLLATAAVLAACSQPAANSVAQGPGANTPSGGAAVAVSDRALPTPKAGLWEIHMGHATGTEPARTSVTQQCLDPAAIAASLKTAADFAQANCSRNETHGGGGTWTTDMVCTTGGSTMTTHSVTTMSGDNAYHTELTSSFDPPIAGRVATTTTVDGKWLGACPT